MRTRTGGGMTIKEFFACLIGALGDVGIMLSPTLGRRWVEGKKDFR